MRSPEKSTTMSSGGFFQPPDFPVPPTRKVGGLDRLSIDPTCTKVEPLFQKSGSL
jgi:hypothetical protein